jgi:hypothetical protein
VLIEDVRTTSEDVHSITAMDIRRRARRPEGVLLGTERKSAERGEPEQLRQSRANPVVGAIDTTRPSG